MAGFWLAGFWLAGFWLAGFWLALPKIPEKNEGFTVPLLFDILALFVVVVTALFVVVVTANELSLVSSALRLFLLTVFLHPGRFLLSLEMLLFMDALFERLSIRLSWI